MIKQLATSHAGLGRVRLHDLQRFYASGLIAAGCDIVTVCARSDALGDVRH